MLFIRRFEEHCDKAYRQDKIGGYLHLYIGQEALALGFIHHLRPEDRVLGHYRDHAYVLALGSDPRAVMAELYGKVTGLCRGKGGSMHLYDKANNFLGGYGIVGDVTGIATGVAFAQKYEETGRHDALLLRRRRHERRDCCTSRSTWQGCGNCP
jgi:pyruvate dehydrogenase E1 component alpha subunit